MGKYRAIFDTKGLLAEYEDDELTFIRADYEPPLRSDLPRPMVMRDIQPYKNMINGQMISSRSEHRELLRRHNCIEIGNEKMETRTMRPDGNARKKLIAQQLADVSDKECDVVLNQLRGH